MTEINIIKASLGEVAGYLKEYGSIFIVFDENVADLVGKLGVDAKGTLGIEVSEDGKNIQTVMEIDQWLMELGANRDAFLLGIGGGITTDIVGFAASIYKRGIRFGFIPTTLLSQVDAAIGGKNGVNLDSYKNMIGIIRQPEMTFICPEALDSLPYEQILSGAAELLKTFIISNQDDNYERTVKALEAKDIDALKELSGAAAAVKAGVAGRDPDERGERRLLNLGHTFAHSIEKNSEESIGHGQAVSMGMILAARLSEAAGVAEKGLAAKLEADFRKCGMPTECPYTIEELADAMKKDKKAEGSIVHFVLPVRIGEVITRDLTVEEAVDLLK